MTFSKLLIKKKNKLNDILTQNSSKHWGSALVLQTAPKLPELFHQPKQNLKNKYMYTAVLCLQF